MLAFGWFLLLVVWLALGPEVEWVWEEGMLLVLLLLSSGCEVWLGVLVL